ncbi:MAG: AAA family ATPase [Synergistaceae bacterium]|jgi:SpoVK/Ycf46/Vps4 family AAA+-type ATPase|nr:AAA family ATPase [Synergistaceae bacterium]
MVKNSHEVLYERRKAAEWLLVLLKSGADMDFPFFKCMKWIMGGLKPLIKALAKDAVAELSGEPDAEDDVKAVRNAAQWTEKTLIAHFDDLLDDHPYLVNVARRRFMQECKEVTASFSRDSGNYARVRRSFGKIFGVSREAAVLSESVYLLQTRPYLESYFVGDMEVWKPMERDTLARMLGVSLPDLQEAIRELTSSGLLEISKCCFRLVNGVASLWDGGSTQDVTRAFCVPLAGDALPLKNFRVSEDVLDHVKALLSKKEGDKKAPVHILLYGPPGTGKTTFARSLAKNLNVKAWAVASRADDDDDDRRASLTACLNLAAQHVGSFVLVDEAERLLDTSWESKDKAWLNSFLEQPGRRMIWITNQIGHIDPAVLRRFSFSVHFGALGKQERRNLWEQVIARHRVKSCFPDSRVSILAENYQIPAAVIEGAISQAKALGYSTKEFGGAVERVLQAHVTLRNNGRPTLPKVKSEEDYTLSGVCLDSSVDELLDKCRRADAVYVANGALRRGCGTMLFYGPPGTGKTALARYIAHEIGRECVVKRASDLLSPLVGEAEQNVAEAFRRAEVEGAVLVIDEADTFLYSRETAQRSWESSLVNEFLTALEECRGFCICTTNRMETMDAAAMRRFPFKVRFTYAGAEQAVALYSALLAPMVSGKLPEALEAELHGMTRLAPGDFHVVRSQYWLAERGEVSHEELIRALRREQDMKRDHEGRKVGFSV